MTVSSPASAPNWSAFRVLLAGGFMTLLDVSIVNVALPSITLNLDASASQLQWIVAGYSLAFALILLPAGRLGDIFGRGRIFALAIAGFTFSSLACGLAPSAVWLIIFRFLQGTFAGLLNPQVLGLIQELFSGPDRGRAFGYNGASIGVSTALGPVLGGLIISLLPLTWGWRVIFLINVPIGLFVVPLALRRLPLNSHKRVGKLYFDLPGLGLMGASTLLIMLPLIIATQDATPLNAPWWMLLFAVVSAVGFAFWESFSEKRDNDVLMPKKLLKTTSFILGAGIGTVYFVGFSGYFVALNLYLLNGLGLPAWKAGLIQLPFALGGIISSVLSGRLLVRAGRLLVASGLFFTLLGMGAVCALVLFAPTGGMTWLLPFFFFIAGCGNGFVISPNVTLTLEEIPLSGASTAAALLQIIQRIGTTLSITLLTLVFFAALPLSLRTQAATSDLERTYFSHAFAAALGVIQVAMGLALCLAIVDIFQRRKVSGRESKN
ncbi:MFS transporter [Actinomycetaceae bacterium TAE3-ERU4]|nr:MFS transporter [Actinomycetaceae bacterium TAE3-ERU4]